MLISSAETISLMNIEVKKLCEAKRFSEAINFAKELPKDQVENLVAISGFLKSEEKGENRDRFLKESVFALVEIGGMEGIKETLPLFELFADSVSAKQLETGILQKAEKLHEIASSGH